MKIALGWICFIPFAAIITRRWPCREYANAILFHGVLLLQYYCLPFVNLVGGRDACLAFAGIGTFHFSFRMGRTIRRKYITPETYLAIILYNSQCADRCGAASHQSPQILSDPWCIKQLPSSFNNAHACFWIIIVIITNDHDTSRRSGQHPVQFNGFFPAATRCALIRLQRIWRHSTCSSSFRRREFTLPRRFTNNSIWKFVQPLRLLRRMLQKQSQAHQITAAHHPLKQAGLWKKLLAKQRPVNTCKAVLAHLS